MELIRLFKMFGGDVGQHLLILFIYHHNCTIFLSTIEVFPDDNNSSDGQMSDYVQLFTLQSIKNVPLHISRS